MMDFDSIFQHAITTADLTGVMKALDKASKVDTQSDSFAIILALSIKNGDEAVFARLLGYIPNLTLRARSEVVKHSRQHLIRRELWKIISQLIMGIVTDFCFNLFCYYALSSGLLYIVLHPSGRAREASAGCYYRLHNSASPFRVWMLFLIFDGTRQRFSQNFFFELLDSGLVFLWLATAKSFISPSSWIGDCIHQGSSSLSLKGLRTCNMLNRYMPTWRRKYFAIVLGPDRVLALSTQNTNSPPQKDHFGLVLSQLLRSKCNEEALMLEYIKLVVFENINEVCGAGHEILIWAARNGYFRVLQELLTSNIDINLVVADSDEFRFRGPPSGSALFWAAAAGHDDLVELLLRNGAEVNEVPDRSPLIGATMYSHRMFHNENMHKYVQCASHLVQAGVNPNAVDEQGRSAISWSVRPAQRPILDLLLKAGADPNAADEELKLPLHYAARFAASQGVIRALLAKTVDADRVDKDGTSALTWALWSGDCPPTIELLLNATSNLNLGGGIYCSPLGVASRYCSSTIVKMLLDKGGDPNVMGGNHCSCIAALLDRPFNDSVLEDDLLCLELLLSNGAKANSRMKNGKQALHAAAEFCWHTEIFEMLLQYGADVNGTFQSREQDFETTTPPLGVLSSSKIARELIRRGADIKARSLLEGATALHDAATAARSDTIRDLIEMGSDIAARDKRGNTPLHNVCWRTPDRRKPQEKMKNFFEARTRLYELKMESELVQSIELLLTLGHADPKARDTDGATPLHHAVKACNSLTAQALIKLTSSEILLERDSKEKLPLHWAAEAGFTDGFHSLVDFSSCLKAAHESHDTKKVRGAILAFKRYINAPDMFGNTALHYAAKNGHETFVDRLLLGQRFIDISTRNRDGHTALDLAKKNDQVWVVAKLRDAAGKIEARHASLQEDETSFPLVRS